MENSPAEQLNRAHKFLIDRDRITAEQAAAEFERFRVKLVCGPGVQRSPTLQAALLTALNVAIRVRPGSAQVVLENDFPPSVPWPAQSFAAAINQLDANALKTTVGAATTIAFGDGGNQHNLRVTFDGWNAVVGPASRLSQLQEREHCILAGILGGALAVSELFMSAFRIVPEALTRIVGLSAWRPDLAWHNPDALGPVVEYLPGEFWCLGLGHLGQAYLWAIGMLPFERPGDVNLLLQDPQRMASANLGTCALAKAGDVDTHKTRVCRRWLEARGFRPSVVERIFDEQTHWKTGEPALGLCGFDGNGPRHLLDNAGFAKVVECGLGGRADNFDSMLIHSLPRDDVRSADFWKPATGSDDDARIRRLVEDHPAYVLPGSTCGELQLEKAKQSVAVPFVGAVAASLLISETLRMVNGGQCYDAIDLRLSSPRLIRAMPGKHDYAVRGARIDFRKVGRGAS